MSDLFGNHIVGFPMRRLISSVLVVLSCVGCPWKTGVRLHFCCMFVITMLYGAVI